MSAQPLDNESTPQPPPPRPGFLQQRLVSLDVYRGLIMVTLAFTGFGLAGTARLHLEQDPESAFWKGVYHHWEHAEWVGCGYWDLIQPSFMFMVGAAMAFSYAKRQRQGESWLGMFRHALVRSVVLIVLGIFLTVDISRPTGLMNVLTQIGLGYTFLFLLWNRPAWLQFTAAVLILAGTWALYTNYPATPINPATGASEVGVTPQWATKHLKDVPAVWQKNVNVGHAVDVWFLNKLPQPQPFVFNSGGYQTINFIPELATMIFGLMTGELLRRSSVRWRNLAILIVTGAAAVAVGYYLEVAGVSPLVKRIWTPSWAIFSTGWCLLILAFLYGVIDVAGLKWWTFPLVVVGVNSIAIYSMSQVLKGRTAQTWQTLFGKDVFQILGENYVPMVEHTLVGLTFWFVCLWLYRQKIFLRI